MHFGSRYVYAYDSSDSEEVSDDEFQEGMTLSDSDEEDSPGSSSKDKTDKAKPSAAPPPPPAPPAKSWFSFGGAKAKLFSAGTSTEAKKQEDGPAITKPKGYKKKKSHWRLSSSEQRQEIASAITWRRARRADTNVMVVKFDQLAEPSQMHAGEPIECSSCKAMLFHLSKVHSQGEQQIWTCEFCSNENPVDIEPEEIPKTQDVTFMLEPAPSMEATTSAGKDQSLVIFCVDVSGSMCVTTEVPGKVQLRGADRLARLQSLNEERENQFLPNQKRNVTYVSRLQGMQAAVDHQLGAMATEHPDRKVGLVTFNNEVTVVGDGSAPALVVAGDKLGEREELLKIAGEVIQPGCIKNSRNALGDKVFDLEERGATALGPALMLSVAIAGQAPGSKVIVCTDGIANIGLGSLEKVSSSDEELQKATEFYTDVSLLAQEKGVSVSVISIQGTDCKMMELGRVADETGGQVNIVDPMKLTQEFGSILADPIIATNVSATFHVHSRLYIRDEESQENKLDRYVGNVTKSTEISFEYGMRSNQKHKKQKTSKNTAKSSKPDTVKEQEGEGDTVEKTPEAATVAGMAEGAAAEGAAAEGAAARGSVAKGPSITDSGLKELPFQLLIKYTDLEGAKALRCITQSMPITKVRQVAEEEMDLGVVGAHVAQTSAALALDGQYTESRMNALMGQRLAARYGKINKSNRDAYKSYVANVAPMEKCLNQAQQSEEKEFGARLSEDEDEDLGERRTKSRSKPRRATASDEAARHMYVAKKMTSNHFSK